MKKKTPEQQIKEYCKEILQEIEQWKHINQCGCNDPSWPDGTNMNLTRNHIIYYKCQITEICQKCNLQIPPEYYSPLPPEVEDSYMADIHTYRAKRLRAWGDNLTTRKHKYNDEQMCLF